MTASTVSSSTLPPSLHLMVRTDKSRTRPQRFHITLPNSSLVIVAFYLPAVLCAIMIAQCSVDIQRRQRFLTRRFARRLELRA